MTLHRLSRDSKLQSSWWLVGCSGRRSGSGRLGLRGPPPPYCPYETELGYTGLAALACISLIETRPCTASASLLQRLYLYQSAITHSAWILWLTPLRDSAGGLPFDTEARAPGHQLASTHAGLRPLWRYVVFLSCIRNLGVYIRVFNQLARIYMAASGLHRLLRGP